MVLENRLVKIDSIDLYSALHIKEFYQPDNKISKNYNGISGNIITFIKDKVSEYRTAYSFESGWLSYDNKVDILNLYNEIDKTFNLTYTDNSVELVRFNHSKGIDFKPLFEGSKYYTATLNFITIPM